MTRLDSDSEYQAARFAHDLLSVFDVWEESLDFLASLIGSGAVPDEELQSLLNLSLLGGAEAWHASVDCATSVHNARRHKIHCLDGHDVLASLWLVLNAPGETAPPARPWAETDRLIGLARKLERDVAVTLRKDLGPRPRPLPGIISCVPFPPLTAPSFGLIQEKLAHEPFWLLIAITFLIKTNGKLAIPAFYKVRQRFPTLDALADTNNQEELLGMIQHLGLSKIRLRYIHRYARAFLHHPPRAGVRYRVRNYDRRDASPPPRDPADDKDSHLVLSLSNGGGLEAWEIGHMTKGKYTIDSWRIFCRDELLGRAKGWNGEGREPEFQPEWMRVRPDDKELRACLRWMWMREGWEWDPATGERTVLRDEMRRAVNEGRAEYDETGGLRIGGVR